MCVAHGNLRSACPALAVYGICMDEATCSLLIIDDESFVRDGLTAYLETSGYHVSAAADAQQGLELCNRLQPEVILLNPQLDNSDGELLRKLCQHPAEIPVIIIFGAETVEAVMAALRNGATDYLTRNQTHPEGLRDALARCLEHSRRRRENRIYRLQLEETNRTLRGSLSALQQEQLAGRHVQMKMLPRSPKRFGPYLFSCRIIPSLYLSGDFADYFTVGEQHVVFFIADVSGHGASSAFVTVLLKNLFARKRSDYLHRDDPAILSPVAMLTRANQELMATDIDKYVTLCVGVLDIPANTLLYSVAGHLPQPILSTEGHARFLDVQSPPVGLFADAEYRAELVQLPEDFVLTLLSDGILEVLPQPALDDKEAVLLQALRLHRSATAALKALGLAELRDVPDDIAVLLISRKGETDGAR